MRINELRRSWKFIYLAWMLIVLDDVRLCTRMYFGAGMGCDGMGWKVFMGFGWMEGVEELRS